MTIRNLNFLFNPSSVALVEAGSASGSIGAVLARNLAGAGFKGDMFFVHPEYRTIEGLASYPDVGSLPKAPDLAVIAAPPDSVPKIIEALAGRGTRAAVVMSAGFREGGPSLQERMRDAARPCLLRIAGPGCMGIMVPGKGLNASIGHVQPIKGNIAFVSQSGSVQAAVLDWATSRGIGFSHFVSLGDMADIDFGDILDYLAMDFTAKAILLHMETVTHTRKFMSAARAAARMKPVIVVKGGRHFEGALAAASHTGMAAGGDEVYNAAFIRAGMLRVIDIQALFDALETLAVSRPFSGERLAILTNGGGMGVLAADTLIDKKGRLSALSAETVARLNRVLPRPWSHGNPVDIVGDAPPGRYGDALKILLEDEGVDAVLVLNSPSAVSSGIETAQAVVEALKETPSRAASRGIFTCFMGADAAREVRRIFAENRIPTYETPTEAVRGFMQMVRYRRSQEMLMETPSDIPEAFVPERNLALEIVNKALSEGRTDLTGEEAKAVLAAYKIPVQRTGEPAANRPNARELMIGVREDAQFGPVILFGQGGAGVDVIQDKAAALPPLNMHLAGEVMRRTRVCRLLGCYSDRPAVHANAVSLTLVKVSQLIIDIADIAELDINPLLADEQGVLVLDAAVKLVTSRMPAAQRLAIRPYPAELEKTVTLPGGRKMLLRPIRPEDEPAFHALFSRLSMDEIRLRFLHPMTFLSHEMAARLTQIDYDREMAMVLCETAPLTDPVLHGMVRLTAEPDNERAEFAILIHRDMTGMGLGPMLMRRIIEYGRTRGIREIFGEVLADNGPMLKLSDALGFKRRRDPDDPGVVIISLAL